MIITYNNESLLKYQSAYRHTVNSTEKLSNRLKTHQIIYRLRSIFNEQQFSFLFFCFVVEF